VPSSGLQRVGSSEACEAKTLEGRVSEEQRGKYENTCTIAALLLCRSSFCEGAFWGWVDLQHR